MTVSLGNGRPLVPGPVRFDGGTGINALFVDAASTGLDGALVTHPGEVSADGQAVSYVSVDTLGLNNALAVNSVSGPDTADRAAAFAGLSAQERFVQALYLDALGRAGSVAELDMFWLPVLNGPGGQGAVAAAIEGSLEARDHLVQTWYRTYLGRAADGTEELGWVAALQSQGEEQVLSRFLGDPVNNEFYDRAQGLVAAGTADQRFVQALSRFLLGRAAGEDEVAAWVAQLPGAGRQGVVLGFLQSQEFRAELFEGYYDGLLHRPAGAGLDGWLALSLDAHSARVAFESADEFFLYG
jgi:hypothetical protein